MTTNFSHLPTWVIISAIALGVWSMFWKALALYKAGTLKQPLWFIVLFILNTAGILEIFYLLVFSKMAKPVKVKQAVKDSIDAHPNTEPHIIKSHD